MQISFPSNLHVGTSSWSTTDWCGSFYPHSIEPVEMITEYAKQFSTVEIDSSWYRMPSMSMVDAWNVRTPSGFIFSAKVPRVITHDKYLEGCEEEINQFVSVMSRLGEKLGPLVFQFPYVAKGKDPNEYATGADFLRRLKSFVKILPIDFQWAIEIRNSHWVKSELLDILRDHGIALAFIDYYTMDPLPKLSRQAGIITAPFAYLRFLGNHKQMDAAIQQERTEGRRKSDWESLLVDRTAQMRYWMPAIRDLTAKEENIYIYFNNHYAGYAPGSVELFLKLWQEEMPIKN